MKENIVIIGSGHAGGMLSSLLRKEKYVNKALELIRKSGASYAQMTGTGSAVFGLYRAVNNSDTNRAITQARELGWSTYFGALA